ncbi:hypothetical protein EXN66_Car006391 [Channa argus]|uniref:Uncharacterized protein n=1 Tax=Channa argus TaxID=215402 RepID=A0A6G1PL58_CHAAH|nr:hypothetical protein EXN66_Car006391 [Channa argus]
MKKEIQLDSRLTFTLCLWLLRCSVFSLVFCCHFTLYIRTALNCLKAVLKNWTKNKKGTVEGGHQDTNDSSEGDTSFQQTVHTTTAAQVISQSSDGQKAPFGSYQTVEPFST